jgi:hypothetical protein
MRYPGSEKRGAREHPGEWECKRGTRSQRLAKIGNGAALALVAKTKVDFRRGCGCLISFHKVATTTSHPRHSPLPSVIYSEGLKVYPPHSFLPSKRFMNVTINSFPPRLLATPPPHTPTVTRSRPYYAKIRYFCIAIYILYWPRTRRLRLSRC